MGACALLWAGLALLASLPAGAAPGEGSSAVPDTRAARDLVIAERRRAQNRLVSDLAVHNFAGAGCAVQLRQESSGTKCWINALSLDAGFGLDRQAPGRTDRFTRSVFLGWQPLTLGSWFWRDEHRFFDFEFALLEPFVMVRAGALYQPSADGERELEKFLGVIAGSRAWVGFAPFRLGAEVSYETGAPEVNRGLTVSFFAGLAYHFAPLRAAPERPSASKIR